MMQIKEIQEYAQVRVKQELTYVTSSVEPYLKTFKVVV